MLKTIAKHSTKLIHFLFALELVLFKPQVRHLTQLVDALIVCDSRKTLSSLYRQFVDELDPKAAADFFRESPWQVDQIGLPRKRFMLDQFLRFWPILEPDAIVISIDDSLGIKHKDTRHLEAVDFQHNHTESTRKKQVYSNGYVFVETHVQMDGIGFLYDAQLYLRAKMVRRLNRKRSKENRLPYRSKYRIARAMLVELAAQLPKDRPVYVTFDSWYASAKLIKYCRRQGWHVICALKSNRCLDKKQVRYHDQALKHKRYIRVRMRAVDDTQPPSYYVRQIRGRLNDVPGQVHVLISRRHPGHKRPKYFMCTDTSLSAQEALRIYQQRWPVEVDNFYLKEALGLSDFRLQSFEAIGKWFAVVLMALNYLQYQQAQDYVQSHTCHSLADFIRQHRIEHAQDVLRAVAEQVMHSGDIEAVLNRFIVFDSRAVA